MWRNSRQYSAPSQHGLRPLSFAFTRQRSDGAIKWLSRRTIGDVASFRSCDHGCTQLHGHVAVPMPSSGPRERHAHRGPNLNEPTRAAPARTHHRCGRSIGAAPPPRLRLHAHTSRPNCGGNDAARVIYLCTHLHTHASPPRALRHTLHVQT